MFVKVAHVLADRRQGLRSEPFVILREGMVSEKLQRKLHLPDPVVLDIAAILELVLAVLPLSFRAEVTFRGADRFSRRQQAYNNKRMTGVKTRL